MELHVGQADSLRLEFCQATWVLKSPGSGTYGPFYVLHGNGTSTITLARALEFPGAMLSPGHGALYQFGGTEPLRLRRYVWLAGTNQIEFGGSGKCEPL